MPFIRTDDAVDLFYEETGTGVPIVFVHEFADDYRSYEPQIRFFCRHHRCIAFNARGYPPSAIPITPEQYSQERAREDILAVLNGLNLEKAHIIGLSMGAFAALHFGFTYPDRTLSIVIAGCGYGASPDDRGQFAADAEASAARFERIGMTRAAEGYATGPTRVQYQRKDPRGWAEFRNRLGEHSAQGSALTMRGVQKQRPSLYDLVGEMNRINAPTLIVTGDEDWPCLEAGILMKKSIRTAGLVVVPNTGHAVNLEEAAEFNQQIARFLHAVEIRRWPERDPRALAPSLLGVPES